MKSDIAYTKDKSFLYNVSLGAKTFRFLAGYFTTKEIWLCTHITKRKSHKMRGLRDGKLQSVTIPTHKEVVSETLKSILIQANVTKKE